MVGSLGISSHEAENYGHDVKMPSINQNQWAAVPCNSLHRFDSLIALIAKCMVSSSLWKDLVKNWFTFKTNLIIFNKL